MVDLVCDPELEPFYRRFEMMLALGHGRAAAPPARAPSDFVFLKHKLSRAAWLRGPAMACVSETQSPLAGGTR